MNRDHIVPVRFDEKGLAKLNQLRGQTSRSSFIRQALAFAIKNGFKAKEEL